MGELSLIEKFRAGAPGHPCIAVGPGHDCAVLHWPVSTDLLFKIDQVVEGTHFLLDGPDVSRPFQVGWKAMAKACSDIAAAGGWPLAATVAINLRKGSSETLALGVYKGLVACCKKFEIGLAGGDFSTSQNGLSIVVSLLGKCRSGGAWTRGGAQSGDVLLVTGSLGGSRSSKHKRFVPRLKEALRIREICPRGVKACIDITDGLSRDLRHICDESSCGARLFEAEIPVSRAAKQASTNPADALRQALSDGEDFELLMAVERRAAGKLLDQWLRLKHEFSWLAPLKHIGEIVPSALGISMLGADGKMRPLPDAGYEHTV
jgi:thiamine-monophosphate kinase